MHKNIFANQTKLLDKCRCLAKLNDYYVDVYYINGDIYKLKNDLQLFYEFTNNEEVKSFIDSFIQLCNYAITEDYNIYCFSD